MHRNIPLDKSNRQKPATHNHGTGLRRPDRACASAERDERAIRLEAESQICSPMLNRYQVFGLRIASEIPCPELLGPEPGGTETSHLPASQPPPDCHWCLARLEPELAGASVATAQVQIAPGVYQFLIQDVARYRVRDGREILVDPLPDADPGDVRLWLLGTALGALLHQRGLLPLHVSALTLAGGAQAFCGDSGAGKSTLATALHRRGLPLLTDDVGLAVPEVDGVTFYPGFPRIKLWRDALDHFGLDHRPLIRDLTRIDKYHLRLDPDDGFQAQPLPLRRLYLLERGAEADPVRIERVRGHSAISLLQANTYRPGLVRRLGRAAGHLRQCGRVASAIQVFRLRCPWRLDRLDETLDQLLAHLERPQ